METNIYGEKRTAQHTNVTACCIQVKPESINKGILLNDELVKPWKGHTQPGSKIY